MRPRPDSVPARPTDESSVDLLHPFAQAHSTLPPPLPGDVQRGVAPRDYVVEVVEDDRSLEGRQAEWWDLFMHSIEANVFYSPPFYFAARKHLTPSDDMVVLIVKAIDRSAPGREPTWCGFFPMVRRRRWRGIPANVLTMHSHDYCFLRTPLIRSDAAREVIDLFWNWVRFESGASLIDVPDQTGDGAYHAHLVEGMSRAGLRPTMASTRVRALLCPAENAEAYLRESISGGKLKELRRLERRLREQEGELLFRSLGPDEDPSDAIERFLLVEKSGWKEREGTALACRPAHADFFREAAMELHQRGHLRLNFLEGKTGVIAGKCNLVAKNAAYAFKIGFAEEFARFSPGVQLEIDNIRRFHAEIDLPWMDSCADPDHPMIDHLWRDRRSIHSWWVPLNRWGASIVALFPWVASMRKGLRGNASDSGANV
jgi:CelD/BcsL family acetyltransferase involved in cellulose biosynthesis